MATHSLLIQTITSLTDQTQSIPGLIVEIGSQRHKGQGSSYQLKRLADSQGRQFFTIDADSTIAKVAQEAVGNCSLHCKGEQFLSSVDEPIFCLYLDNYDVAYSASHALDLKGRIGNHYSTTLGYTFEDTCRQNITSALVHLQQLSAAFSRLTQKCIVGIDDTQLRDSQGFKYYWGKGSAVVPVLLQSGFRISAQDSSGIVLSRGLRMPEST
jgi:hypothetical protein